MDHFGLPSIKPFFDGFLSGYRSFLALIQSTFILNNEEKDSLKWAFSTLNTRCVYVDYMDKTKSIPDGKFFFNDSGNVALIPFFDLFNHSPSVNVQLKFDKNLLHVISDTSVSKGDQVFINYGPHDNLTLLAEYGFCYPNNPHDSVQIDKTTFNRVFPLINEETVFSILGIDSAKDWRKLIFLTSQSPSYCALLLAHCSHNIEFGDLYSLDEDELNAKYKLSFEKLAQHLLAEICVGLEELINAKDKQINQSCKYFCDNLIFYFKEQKMLLNKFLHN
ncbi:SET domain-containing protein 4 [Cichlidogyrus casuarinus]|uniref:SET domain-containing protein 4 n=1 Tax=Cichlidogyrus casuarinus TaxID=1844966 RepID=A0ABD2PSN7_9PLAT